MKNTKKKGRALTIKIPASRAAKYRRIAKLVGISDAKMRKLLTGWVTNNDLATNLHLWTDLILYPSRKAAGDASERIKFESWPNLNTSGLILNYPGGQSRVLTENQISRAATAVDGALFQAAQ